MSDKLEGCKPYKPGTLTSYTPLAPPKVKVIRYLLLAVILSVSLSLSAFIPRSIFLLGSIADKEREKTDPADSWKDDTWPFRPQTPWDISTDFRYARTFEYDVTEGTWLRLDVHPKTGDIVFDMLGDIYCLPGSAYLQGISGSASARAAPVLLGVPHDSDPRFSPEGDRLVFRSDAGLGSENIWVKKWTRCEDMDLRPSSGGRVELIKALEFKQVEGGLLANGIKETPERRERRLIQEGRHDAVRVTNETYRWVSDPRFHPSGSSIVATKWYTSDRSVPAGEGWQYSIPPLGDNEGTVKVGSGKRIVGRTLPVGWSAEQYGDQQIGPEQVIWKGEDALIYAKNVADESVFSYNKDIHKGIYAIFYRNLTSGTTETLVDAFPGGASRPELSRDQRTLAFVRRMRDSEVLVLKDLESGTLHHVFNGLTYDLGVISASMGTYPSYAFTPSDDAIVIWASGHIYHVPLAFNDRGEKVASSTARIIPFTAHVEKRVARTLRHSTDLLQLETAESQRVHAFKHLQVNHKGTQAVFQAAGLTYFQAIFDEDSFPRRIPVAHPNSPYYSPTFVYGTDDLILQARWSDSSFTSFEIANLSSGTVYEVGGIPLGRYSSPVLCECTDTHRKIAFVKGGGDLLTGDVVATAGSGLYVGEIDLPSSLLTSEQIFIRNLHLIPTDNPVSASDALKLQFLRGTEQLLVQQADKAFVVNLAAGKDELGVYKTHVLAEGKMSVELVVTLSGLMSGVEVENAAFVDFFHVYLAPGRGSKMDSLWSKPGRSTEGLARLSLDGGHDITWSGDGKKLFWFLGPFLHSLEISLLKGCEAEIRRDTSTYGISCTKKLLKFREIFVNYPTAISRMKAEAAPSPSGEPLGWAIVNATVLTMETGKLETDLIRNAVVIVLDGVIQSVYTHVDADVALPAGTMVIDANGSFVLPGFIDSHAHWSGIDTLYPATSWELQTFLAYGVTTLHNPSSDNRNGYVERFRLENNQLIGPRIFHVGNIIYGAGSPGIHQDITDLDEAYSALIRIKAEGGSASFSYKNYNQPSRASRQRLLTAARDLKMLCVPEGGMNYDWGLTYIIDGMTTHEHSIPVPVLYDDVIRLFTLSGTSYTPTHIVNYGGTWGEEFVWATHDVPNDPKLRRFMRHDILEGLSETTSRPKTSFALFNTSASAAKMVHQGLKTLIGAHGEQPLGLNYHAEMFFTQQGGLTNYETLRAATADAAITLGLFDSLGSVTPGKLADLVIYPRTVDLVNGDIWQSKDISYVVRGGRVWDAESMTEVWPIGGRVQEMPPFNIV